LAEISTNPCGSLVVRVLWALQNALPHARSGAPGRLGLAQVQREIATMTAAAVFRQ
jgi:hypothetical protein